MILYEAPLSASILSLLYTSDSLRPLTRAVTYGTDAATHLATLIASSSSNRGGVFSWSRCFEERFSFAKTSFHSACTGISSLASNRCRTGSSSSSTKSAGISSCPASLDIRNLDKSCRTLSSSVVRRCAGLVPSFPPFQKTNPIGM